MLQFLNASWPIASNLLSPPKLTLYSLTLFWNAPESIEITLSGILILVKLVQFANELLLIYFNCLGKFTNLKRDWFKKASTPILDTTLPSIYSGTVMYLLLPV